MIATPHQNESATPGVNAFAGQKDVRRKIVGHSLKNQPFGKGTKGLVQIGN